MVTLIGLLINAACTAVLIFFGPGPWPCLLAAIGLFAYQTLDAIDGKQVVLLCSAVCA